VLFSNIVIFFTDEYKFGTKVRTSRFRSVHKECGAQIEVGTSGKDGFFSSASIAIIHDSYIELKDTLMFELI